MMCIIGGFVMDRNMIFDCHSHKVGRVSAHQVRHQTQLRGTILRLARRPFIPVRHRIESPFTRRSLRAEDQPFAVPSKPAANRSRHHQPVCLSIAVHKLQFPKSYSIHASRTRKYRYVHNPSNGAIVKAVLKLIKQFYLFISYPPFILH